MTWKFNRFGSLLPRLQTILSKRNSMLGRINSTLPSFPL